MCVCLCVCVQQTGQSDQFKTVKATVFKLDMHAPRDSPDGHDPLKIFRKGVWPGSCDPLNFWALNASSFIMVKASNFKFDVHVFRDSPDMDP